MPIFAYNGNELTMKKVRAFIIAILLIGSTVNVTSQIPGIDFIYGYTDDAKLLLQEYIRPYANIMGANLNAGWYNTAKPHKLGGFDITVTTSIAFAPSSALSYDLSKLQGLSATIGGPSTIAPTAAGKMDARPELVYSADVPNPVTGNTESFELAKIRHPNGSGLKFLPLPMGQVSLGLVFGTDVTVRYLPKLRIGDHGQVGVFGIGGRHSISQWIPVLKQLKFINIAVQGGYTKVSSAVHLNMEPIAEVEIPNPPSWNDQYLNMDISGWTLNLIASQSIPILTVYEGIGFSNSLVELAMTGHYPINTIVTEGADFGKTTYIPVEDPISELEFKNFRNLRLNAGLRIKLAVLTLHYDFTRTLYNTHTVGLGISFR